MATTVRLPEGLQSEATAYAQTLGLSLNNIIAVALRDYLDQRNAARQVPIGGPSVEGAAAVEAPAVEVAPLRAVAPAPPVKGERFSRKDGGESPDAGLVADVGPGKAAAVKLAMQTFKAPSKPRAPCPCKSGRRWNQCHGLPLLARMELQGQ